MITNRYDTIIDFGKFDNSGVDARMGFSPEALGKYFLGAPGGRRCVGR